MSTLSVNTIRDVQNFDPVNTVIGAGFATANSGFSVANAAFARANTALQNTSGTFAGTLTITGNLGVGLSPTYKIDITGGDFRINSSYGLRLEGTSSDQYTQYVSGGTLFWNNGSERLRLNSTGNVSINHTGSWGKLLVGVDGAIFSSTKMNANVVNDVIVVSAPYGNNDSTVANAGAKWGIRLMGAADNQYTNGNKSACIYAVSEDTAAGYNRQVGMAFHTSGFDTTNFERMRIDGNGRVTMPNQPYAEATCSSGYNLGSGASRTLMIWDSITTNVGNCLNVSNGRFTCPVTGVYFLTATAIVQVASTSSDYRIAVHKNGTQVTNVIATKVSGSGGYPSMVFSQMIIANANDYFDVRLWNDAGTGTTQADASFTRFSCILMG